MKLRLQKFLAKAGVASRRASEKLILKGKVKVNNKIVRRLGTKVDPKTDIVKVNNKICRIEENYVYIKMNKPKGVLTTVRDPYGRLTVIDILKNIKTRVYPVGRLDMDSEGLLILTNDGQATYKLTHPKFEIPKTYIVYVKGSIKKGSIKRLENGIMLEDGLTYPAEVKVYQVDECSSTLSIKIHEGRNRQIRRMCKAVGHPVINLKRTSIGSISLNGLKSGEWCYMSKKEVQYLQNIGGNFTIGSN